MVSARKVNYKKLRGFLVAGKWKEANQETKRCMLEVARRKKESYLTEEYIDDFPLKDLRTIDQL